MAAMHGSVNMLEDENYEDEHEFETFAQEFIEQDDWHEAATDRNDSDDEKVTISEPIYQEMHPKNILNITAPVIPNSEFCKIPSILEIIDIERKVFKVSNNNP